MARLLVIDNRGGASGTIGQQAVATPRRTATRS
jgi:tripartite-type tricarboxylate transporter receptor subunit TctC